MKNKKLKAIKNDNNKIEIPQEIKLNINLDLFESEG